MNRSMQRNAVVLLSGGLDSATALAAARAEGFTCHALSVDYGQRHKLELHAANLVAEQLGAASHKVISVDLRLIGGSALTADVAVPKDQHVSIGIPITYVPARNLIFMSLAAGYAETLGAFTLVVGVNAVDYSGYPDCSQEFVDAFIRCVNLGTKAGTQDGHPFAVYSPLVKLGKAEIIRWGTNLGVDYSLTTSCYDPSSDPAGPLACGHCDSCHLRREGFATAGIADPTRYLPSDSHVVPR